jgi:hypothetical protein
VPGAAVPVAIVSTEASPVGAAGAKVAVAPAGTPLAVRLTGPAKLVRASVTFTVPLAPWAIEAVALESVSVNAGAGATVSETAAVASSRPAALARMVIDVVAGEAPVEAARVTVLEVALPVNVAGLNVAVTPVGRFSAESWTASVKFVRVTVTVTEVLVPWVTLAVLADSATAIFPGVVGPSPEPHAASAAVARVKSVRRRVTIGILTFS